MITAWLLAVGRTASRLYLTDHDRDIDFEGNTYQANMRLLDVGEVTESQQVITPTSFSVSCPEGSDEYNFFADDSGLIYGEAIQVEQTYTQNAEGIYEAAWLGLWRFEGILGEGGMVHHQYDGELEHKVTWRFRNPLRYYWTHQAQQARHPGDKGLEYMHQIPELRRQSQWKGINA